MAPPAPIVADLTTVAVKYALLDNNSTASPTPAKASNGELALAELDSSKLKVTITNSPKPYYRPETSQWGRADATTDHWITVRWTDTVGWHAPELRPYTRMDLWPTASCLHYATECFEGLKAYRGYDGKIRLFRPSRNTARLLVSSTRISCPGFSPSAMEELIKALLSVDAEKWLPEPGTFIYIRPTMIGAGRALGVQKPREAFFYIIMALFPKLDNPMKLLASSEDSIRAWPGGFGYAKVGANYGPSLMAQKEAQIRGYDQILWLFGPDASVTEAGASNFFCIIRSKVTGKLELITAPLDDKIILDGVTRRSVLELARERLADELEVVERKYTMADLASAHDEGRLVEAFAAGTAFFVAPVTRIHFRGKDIVPTKTDGEETYTNTIKQWLAQIMYGKVEHEWAVVVEEKGFKSEAVSEAEIEEMVKKIKELKASRAWQAAFEKVKSEELGDA
ncbi:aminotransferase [Sphaerosporella brunnea]|uniref:Branched-chain-amino-acid aminotransferase n=1 Tax=Sphaerosporella brunnea TaxID=1250544 RepID=A0A5J5ERN5_9PEZI|nr:aminotransferase [Sphaerosporella brunnea]